VEKTVVSIGERLDNKYLVMRKLGGGGFGEAFLAKDELIPGRQVAIKVLARPQESSQSDLVREMQALAQFNHPHVVTFYHHFNDENRLFLVMEYCPGGNLYDRLTAGRRCSESSIARRT
jgi:serine/threonine protein kinase